MNSPLALSRPQSYYLGLALLLLVPVRLYGLTEGALPDFDSVRNWQIVQEVAAGDLRHLFRHGSPLFMLLYAPVAWLTSDYRIFLVINAMLALVAVGLLAAFIARETRLPGWQTGLLTLLMGTATFLTYGGRDFTMSAGSLLCFAALLAAYYQRFRQPSSTTLYRAAIWLMLGLSFNYKFLLTLPILAVLEWWRADGLLLQRGHWWRVGLLLAAPFVVLSAVGWLAGLRWYAWVGVYYNVLFPGAANAAGRNATLHLDLLYYLRFLLDFESWLVWVGLLGPLALLGQQWRAGHLRRGQQLLLELYLAIWGWCLLAGMSLLLKAPRGLLWAYGLWYALGLLMLARPWRGRRLPAPALALLVLLALAGNLYRLQREVYAYARPTSYPAVAAWLAAHGGGPVVSTVGLAMTPFHADTVRSIVGEEALPALAHQGYRYVLLDAYWRVTNVQQFNSLRQRPPLAAWPEPSLTSPLLFLEHSEYTGLSYQQTLHLQQQARQDTVQLRVYEISEYVQLRHDVGPGLDPARR
ncbi:hypothetical protein [Hymenobacter terrestris]|uniref:Glycosyltransferase RgtA/B/C/D-like domain-containing protein n=1 Tax=Hymenobacter terrestris TaxID=2748310 RepID=A0ABX2QA31_9BACT|nr:hypothetical protein [Hymenobacter terrestris]NVO86821.1 hypothetical protein [Hymenobacter terrestris]